MADDFFESNTSTFLKCENFKGCLVLFLSDGSPKRELPGKGDNPKPWYLVDGTLRVLDGTPDIDDEDEHAGKKVPFEVKEFAMNGSSNIRAAEKTGKSGKPLLGRVVKSRTSHGGWTYIVNTDNLTAADYELARPHAQEMVAANDPFEK